MFSKPNAIVYVRRTGLIIAGKKLAPARLTFEPADFANLEIIHHEKFINRAQKFFEEHGLHGKHILVVLDASLVFEKSAAIESKDEAEHIRDDFLDAMPLPIGKRACLTVRGQSSVELYATNIDIYTDIAEALHRASAGHILAITPAVAYPAAEGKQQLAAAVQQYISDAKTRSIANFASADAV